MRRPDAPRILGDRYELQRRLGSGGAGTVWRAHDHTLGRGVAIKLLHADLADDPAIEARFRTEATAAARLTHPNAVQVYDVGRDEHDDYLVMELVEGPSLAVLLRQGPLPPGAAAAVAAKVAAALGAAHDAGIVHRDVKPANVLLSPDGRVKLADFGIARVLGEASARLTRAGTMLGTARYLAPEQLGDDPVDERADVYALGLVLFEAVTGQQPFGDGTPVEVATRRLTTGLPPVRQIAPDVPEEIERVVDRATETEPDDRFADGRALASALAPLASPDAERVLAQRMQDLRRSREADDGGPAPAHDAHQQGGTQVATSGSTRGAQSDSAPAAQSDSAPAARAGRPPADAGSRPPAEAPTTRAPRENNAPHHGVPAAAAGPAGPPAGQPNGAPTPDRTATMPAVADTAAGTATKAGGPPPRPQPKRDPGGGASTAVRWVLVALVAIAVVVAAILVLGDDERPGGDGDASPGDPETALEIVDVGDHDPDGDLREWPDRVGDAIDGNPETFWPTESYHDADIFGPEKDGVGLWITLEESATLTDVEIDLSADGGALELWLGDGAPPEDQLPSDWGELIHEGQIGSADLRIDDLPDDVEGDTLVIWFKELPPGGNGYRGEIRDIRVYGE